MTEGRNRPVRLSVRTAPFHGAERGSIPLRAIELPTNGIQVKWQDVTTFHPVQEEKEVKAPEQLIAVPGLFRGRSSAWLEHSTVTREVAGSSPVGPVIDNGLELPWW